MAHIVNCMSKKMKACKIMQNIHPFSATFPVHIQHKLPLTYRQTASMSSVHYGGRYTVTLLPGSGIGPELTSYVKEIFRFSGVPVDFEEINVNLDSENSDDLDYAVNSIRRNGIALKGNIESTNGCGDGEVLSGNVLLRKKLELYVNSVHCTSYPGIKSRHSDIDVVIIRQNTEGEYAMLEHEAVNGVVESMKVITKTNAEKVIRYAFEYAKWNSRKKITTVHKANIMKLSDGLFLKTAKEIGREYPDIVQNDMIVDNACMQLVSNPHQFDMILTTNLYGSIISNVICGLLGGAGLISGQNIGEFYTIFEPATRNTGTEIAGQNVANPIAMINASVDMLNCLGLRNHGKFIKDAIMGSIEDGVITRDIGGTATSREVVDKIKERIEKSSAWA